MSAFVLANLISTFCVRADCLHGISKAFRCAILYNLFIRFFGKVTTVVLKMITKPILCDWSMFSSVGLSLDAGKMRQIHLSQSAFGIIL
jgi:hypothetical protein